MNQITITFLILIISSFLCIVFARKSLKKARQEARQYKNYRATRHKRQNKGKQLPHQFSEKSILDAANHYSRRANHTLAFDTNILIEYPDILLKIANKISIPLFISQQVRYELDHLKDNDDDLNQRARIALKHISNLHKENKLEIVYYDKAFMKKHGFQADVADDRIICSYLEKVNDFTKIIFITNDNNARTTARTTELIPLELDWNGIGKKKSKNREFRPGYFHTVLAIALFSLAFGLFNGAMNVERGKHLILDNFGSFTKASDSTKSTKRSKKPTYIEHKKYPFITTSEYDDTFQGKKIKGWGASAIVDISYLERSTFRKPTIKIVLGSWIEDDFSKKENDLRYILVTKDGQEYEQKRLIIKAYSYEKGISLHSVDARVLFSGINSFELLDFELHDIDEADPSSIAKGAKLRLEHKVTGDKITTIPLKLIKNKVK